MGLINQRTWMGHFEVWADDGEIVGLVTGGNQQLIQSGRALEPFNLAGEHGGA